MTLLQISGLPSPWQIAPGLGAEAARSQNNFGTIFFWSVFLLCFVCLSEPLKVIFRKNIGGRALNINWIIGSATIYLWWALGLLFIVFIMNKGFYNSSPWWFKYYASVYTVIPVAIFYGYLAFSVLLKGMNEHFRAKALDSQIWQVLEYRGDSFRVGAGEKQGASKEIIWRRKEPILSVRIALLLTVVHVALGFPLLITALSFWLNEWYQVYHKAEKTRESFLDMKIEMQKSSMYYNETNATEKPSRVSVD